MRVLFDSYCPDEFNPAAWQAIVLETVRLAVASEQVSQVFLLSDSRLNPAIATEFAGEQSVEFVDFPRRLDAHATRAIEADLLTRVADSLDVDVVVTSGPGYVTGIPIVVVRMDDVPEDAGDMPQHGVSLELSLVTAFASAVVVQSAAAARRIARAYPFLQKSDIRTARNGRIADAVVAAIADALSKAPWQDSPEAHALISDYQSRAQRIQV